MKTRFPVLLWFFAGIATTSPSVAQWVQTNGPFGGNVNTLLVSGTNLFAGMFGAGVFLSTNTGSNWTAVNAGLTNTIIRSLAVGPNGAGGTNPFAGTSGGGVYLSSNNGTKWAAVDSGLITLNITALAGSPSGTGGMNVFAGTACKSGFEVWHRSQTCSDYETA